MDRDQFDHAVRASAAVAGTDELIVIGSQAAYGSFSELPDVATRSVEADIVIPGIETARMAFVHRRRLGERRLSGSLDRNHSGQPCEEGSRNGTGEGRLIRHPHGPRDRPPTEVSSRLAALPGPRRRR